MSPEKGKKVQAELPSLKTTFERNKPQEKGRGNLTSSMNPRTVENVTGRKGEEMPNPFFETMPAPLVWHRNMPDRFPFGETPFMEQYLSNQIEKDLKMDKDNKEDIMPPRKLVSLWDLPEISDEDVLAAMKSFDDEEETTTKKPTKRVADKQKGKKQTKKRKIRK